MARPRRVMLLVDFDNCSPEVIAQAFEIAFKDYGAIHVRRAYCTAEQAQHNAGFLKRLSLRPMVNLSVGKNSTDIALAVDAMDLVIAERPDVVAIVSSDSDFTPLVGRLREKGAWVRGFGQQGKTGEGVQAAYDQYDDIEHRAAKVAAKKKATQKPAENKPLVTKPAAKPVERQAPEPVTEAPAPKPARKRAPRAKKVVEAAPVIEPVVVEAVALPAEVEAILQAVPVLRGGERVELGEAAQALRQAGLLGRTQASTRLFKKHAEHFVLSPELQPNKVQFWPDAGS